MKETKIYCKKEYTEIDYSKVTFSTKKLNYNCVFKVNNFYKMFEEGIYIRIIDDEKRELRFNKYSPFAKDGFIEHFSTLKELRKNKLQHITSKHS